MKKTILAAKPKRIIKWAKYISQNGSNGHDFQYIPEKEVEERFGRFDNDPDELYEFEEDESIPDELRPIVLTPTGVIPLRPFNDFTKHFNLWLGSTNFNIGEKVALTINNTKGVEMLSVYARYKFRIAVGDCFEFQTVRQNIEKSLGVISQKTLSH